MKFDCIKTNNLNELNYQDVDVIAIDEAQFFIGLKVFVEKALKHSKTVILTGLDGDYKQGKIGEILDCIPLADKVFKLSAMCMKCMDGTHGPFTKRIVNSDKVELVGGKEMYMAVCRKHL
tara:strand:- start:100 stop:459 length:360 start_codon:yes stop_codon:yes gene_type:complete